MTPLHTNFSSARVPACTSFAQHRAKTAAHGASSSSASGMNQRQRTVGCRAQNGSLKVASETGGGAPGSRANQEKKGIHNMPLSENRWRGVAPAGWTATRKGLPWMGTAPSVTQSIAAPAFVAVYDLARNPRLLRGHFVSYISYFNGFPWTETAPSVM